MDDNFACKANCKNKRIPRYCFLTLKFSIEIIEILSKEIKKKKMEISNSTTPGTLKNGRKKTENRQQKLLTDTEVLQEEVPAGSWKSLGGRYFI